MNGGAWEYTAGYVANNNGNIATYGGKLVTSGYEKYINKYEPGSSDSQAEHYSKADPTSSSNTVKHYGDAVWETSGNINGNYGWYGDSSNLPYSVNPFFERGGYSGNVTAAGMFAFIYNSGGTARDLRFSHDYVCTLIKPKKRT